MKKEQGVIMYLYFIVHVQFKDSIFVTLRCYQS